jgi:sugar/nucleoside kinase (ribokinase family)
VINTDGGGILVVGDIITDVLAVYEGPIAVGSDTPSANSITGGGSAANTATWLAWLGVPVRLVAVVGDDAAGTDRVTELESSGVDCSFVRRAAMATTGSIVVLSQASERSFLCDRGANQLLRSSDVEDALAAGAAHLHMSGYTLLDPSSHPASRRALRAARRRPPTAWRSDSPRALTRRRSRRSRAPAVQRSWTGSAGSMSCSRTSPRRARCWPPGSRARELATSLATVACNAVVKSATAALYTGPAGTASLPAVPTASVVDPTGR